MSAGKAKRIGIPSRLDAAFSEVVNTDEQKTSRFAELRTKDVRIDADNPRALCVQVDHAIELGERVDAEDPEELASEMLAAASDIKNSGVAHKELVDLIGLANSIRTHGVLNPVLVYENRSLYRLISGERRFLAARIAGLSKIPARIYAEKPRESVLRAIQLVENAQRTDLSIDERLQNLEMIRDGIRNETGESMDIPMTMRAMSCSRTMAMWHLRVMEGPQDVRQAIKDGILTSLEKAATLAVIKSQSERRALINSAATTSVADLRDRVRNSARRSRAGGRRRTSVQVRLKTPDIARRFLRAVLNDPEFSNYSNVVGSVERLETIDDLDKAWKELIEALAQDQ